MFQIDYNNHSSAEDTEVTTTGTSASTVSNTKSTTVNSAVPTSTVTSVVSTTIANNAAIVPQYINYNYHENLIVNDRLRTWFKLL
jgi:hypothetical protein